MNDPLPSEATGVDRLEPQNEELINVRKTFLGEEEDEYTKSSRQYLRDQENYVKRIKTYNVWVKKPAHLSSLLLARSGFICENETTIRCEMCKCKFVYEKDTYSMYTRINDLCLLHLKNCPWKGKLMDLQILHLDGESLKRENLLREYQNVTTLLQNGTHDVPYIDIKKTISDFLLIVKKYLTNEDSKKKFLLFNSYVELFKSHYVEIFQSHKNLVDRGIQLIGKKCKHLKNHLVDEAFLKSLTYDPLDVHTYINIVGDANDRTQKLSHPNEDLNMYFKIVKQLKNCEYEDINIYKLIALLGWTYKTSPEGEDPDVSSHILYCRYCFREVNLADYSTLARKHNKLDLFKTIDIEPSGEAPKQSLDGARDALERLTGLADGWIETDEEEESQEGEEGEEKVDEERDGEVRMSAGEEARGDEAEVEETEKGVVEKEQEEIKGVEEKGGEPLGEGNKSNEKEGNGNVSEDANIAPNEEGGTKDLPDEGKSEDQENAEEQEGFSFKWSIKQFFLPKKSTENEDKNENPDDNSPSECSPTSVNQGGLAQNKEGNAPCARKRIKKKVQLENILSRVFLEISRYTEDENLFSKAEHDCYVLRGGPHLAHLDKERTTADIGTDGGNYTDNTVGSDETAGTTRKRTIRAFNLIENHRAFCPYMTEDLYSFSKITKLLFELVMSEFQRRYVMR
ncbi:zinc finger protein, putative [Plasmodium knowlesi strain H]|uniref:Zinc finger protein, putative n=3 Tax=Plasmodium knowlesi TaxID=5850 RepID=A0A5K1V4Z6_PLAKH|nr:zinc finger protein, putative [Plasmodium knowlesi strain H]OTN67142.1 putative Zinc finger protein [Plasmodium knowlesi]CAA9988641.1 zinc finger protein, putative [Plasmodium knowlesi strain H]SBO21500.1 zinc finger protein, putative [Plasmodium knowlesi strain H]SBO21915.1 zinc finger protein, putative [Plasmodium knowlesi strain H]VVS78115.1 zinc finger protein, putative [Plasmodium knowlesi strain H]|eukprot:XP_002259617.1 hypothetical protein, conserved in Plasmodium species [Plasmodium knowlesi strain H]